MEEYEIVEKLQKIDVDITKEELNYHKKRVMVCKEFTFDSAHHLHCYDGKCRTLHGHTYKLVIKVSGIPNEVGIAVDFGEIKKLYNLKVKRILDHQYINKALPKMNTTAENIIYWIWNELNEEFKELDKDLILEELILYETPTSYVILKKEWMMD